MPDFVDPYLDPATGILRNLVHAKTLTELQRAEADAALSGELELDGVPRSNDFSELCKIHRTIFGKIYDWAGQIRTVDIRKNEENSSFFLVVSRIPMGCDYVFGELKAENYLKNLNKADFVRKLSYFYDQLNYIHPFREGNGRAQRIFWSRVAKDAGYRMDWSRVSGIENDTASKLAAEQQDLSLLLNMFNKIVEKIDI